MQKIILNLLVIAVLGLLLPACSQKTSTPTETTTATEQSRERSTRERGDRPERGERGEKGKRPAFSDMLAKMDVNKDGKLSLAEAEGRLKDGFSNIDADSDGFITETEFKNAPKPPRRQRN